MLDFFMPSVTGSVDNSVLICGYLCIARTFSRSRFVFPDHLDTLEKWQGPKLPAAQV